MTLIHVIEAVLLIITIIQYIDYLLFWFTSSVDQSTSYTREIFQDPSFSHSLYVLNDNILLKVILLPLRKLTRQLLTNLPHNTTPS